MHIGRAINAGEIFIVFVVASKNINMCTVIHDIVISSLSARLEAIMFVLWKFPADFEVVKINL